MAPYPTLRPLGLLFSVVQPSYLNDLPHFSTLTLSALVDTAPVAGAGNIAYFTSLKLAATMIRRAPWHASSDDRNRTYCSVEPTPARLHRYKVVGVPLGERLPTLFFSLLPYIYIIAIFLEFFKLFYVEVVLTLRRVAYVATYSLCMSKHIRPPAECIGHNHL